jgi:regulator of nucleoside diphosphate kinase
MNTNHNLTLRPDIVLGLADHRKLIELAMAGDGRDELLDELERARVLPETALPEDVVAMGSRVRYRTGDDEHEVSLVYPAEADIAAGRISVLTPVGTALIGLRQGQSITWRTRDGRQQALTVLAVVHAA